MQARYLTTVWFIALALATSLRAEEPVASYIYPAGGQRGTTCQVRVGGLFLNARCGFHIDAPELHALAPLERVPTTWFEGPLIPLPESQAAESYPQDYATSIVVGADAPLGANYWRLSTAQGATPARRFVVGELPEIIEEEIDGEPIPRSVTLPLTINGRIFPREDVDAWSFAGRRGQTVRAEVCAARLGSPLEARLEVTDSQGRSLAEAIGPAGGDPSLSFTPEADGTYIFRIHDLAFGGLQHYVYRLTLADGPHVATVFPLGAQRGQPARFELLGSGVPSGAVDMQLPDTQASTLAHRFDVGGRLTNPVPIELGNLPERLEREPNDAGRAEAIEISSIINGRIQSPGDVDCYAFTGVKDQAYELDVRAGRLQSPLDPVLVVRDAAGKELLRCDDVAAGNTDARCRFAAPADGSYTLSVEDRLASRGGPAFAYRLRIDRFRPDFKLVLASDALNLVRGGEAKLRIDVDALLTLDAPIELTVEGLPPGVTVAGTRIDAKAMKTELTFTTPAGAPVSTGQLTVLGRAHLGEEEIVRTAAMNVPRGDPAIEQVFWAVAVPTPFKFIGNYRITFEPRGAYVTRHYRLERGGYAGPLEVFLADRQLRHLQGVTGPTVVVPAGVDEFDYTIYMPPWMELGRTSRTCLAAQATVKDADGQEHAVCYTTQNQNEQIVARVSSGLLSLAVDREAIGAVPRGSETVEVKLTRDASQQSPVRLELVAPPHVRGVTAETLTIGAGQTAGSLMIHFADGCGPFNVPLTVRATSLDTKRVAVAEARLEIVAPR